MAIKDSVQEHELLVSSEEWDSDDGEQLFAADHGSDKPRPVSSQGGLLAVFEGYLLDPSMMLARDNYCQKHSGKLKESAPEADQQELFSLYQEAMESTFRQHLTDAGPCGLVSSDGPVVTLQELAHQLQMQGQGACDEEVAELLLSVSDLHAFTAMLDDYRHVEAERAAGGGPLELQGSKAGLHAEEQEDGEERPDLNESLSVTALNPV